MADAASDLKTAILTRIENGAPRGGALRRVGLAIEAQIAWHLART
jgi:hypothetical protein